MWSPIFERDIIPVRIHNEKDTQPIRMETWSDEIQRGDYLIAQAVTLVSRLERISADSVWAHRSSGNRGELLKWIESSDERLYDHTLDHLARRYEQWKKEQSHTFQL